MSDRTVDIWGPRTPHGRGTHWPVRVDSHLADGVNERDVQRWVRSACLLCSNGCGLDIAVSNGRMVGVRGRADDPVNRGRLGPKGRYGWQGQRSDRLLRPLLRRDGELVETDWDTAMAEIFARSSRLLADKGGLSHAFYTSGQLMLEEYYTLAVIGKAGLGTPHMDGNTRLCTATAAASLKESFGADGQPGCYDDVEHCDAIFLYGHNVSETQTVLWARMLDRLQAPDRPALVVADPRRTDAAQRADVHLAVRPGTNLALVNALTHQLIRRGHVDRGYTDQHTVGYQQLADVAQAWPPERAAEVCGVPAEDIARAAEIFGRSERVLSTVLQGFYQSHQATAASVGVNNLHLLRGMLGRPGAGVLQMNGQPTAQNNRECGADGDLPGFRNWDNEDHVAELAQLWDVDPMTIPHWAPPTHAMQIFRYVEQGSIGLLWIAGTNPAVSMPDLPRIRAALRNPDCFTVVSDGYRTETAELADVVLPAALWGEKTGTYTNAERTVHLSEQAVEPPGEARADLAIWLDYARRMGLRDNSGRPLPPWQTPEQAFEAWKRCSAGRPCDYTGITYAMLRERGPVRWPCNTEHPDGAPRLYADPQFPTYTEHCENYGHDLLTGAVVTETEHRALRADGRAILKGAHHMPAPEEPTPRHPLRLITGRTVWHFHTRTKTGRAPQLQQRAPSMWVELSETDARQRGVADGDLVRVESARGTVTAPARVTHTRDGVVFAPFHYADQAANELTLTAWDPVSKQPTFKMAAVQVNAVDKDQPGAAAGAAGER